jgi:hypothetical protein
VDGVFQLDDANEMLNHYYNNDNFKVINGMAKNGKCLLFCSSNGIYFPNDVETFRHKIICNDFYDWSRVGSYCVEYVERIIFIRDVRKMFYVTGINNRYDTIDKVIGLLKDYARGYQLVVAGGSAGAYMATILGVQLKASFVICQGGFWDLYKDNDVIERYYFLNKYKNMPEYEKWYNLDHIMQNNKTPIFYLYGGHNDIDMEQARCAEKYDSVYKLALNSTAHSPAVSTETYIQLLMAESEEIRDIFSLYQDNIVDIPTLEEQIKSTLHFPEVQVRRFFSDQEKKDAYAQLLYKWVLMKQAQAATYRNGNYAHDTKGIIAEPGEGGYMLSGERANIVHCFLVNYQRWRMCQLSA